MRNEENVEKMSESFRDGKYVWVVGCGRAKFALLLVLHRIISIHPHTLPPCNNASDMRDEFFLIIVEEECRLSVI